MDCDRFLEHYSEYVDGLREPDDLAAFERHLESCPTCYRYHKVVARGTDLFRALPRPGTSPDFLPRLKHRLYHVDDRAVLGGRPGGSAALVAVAAVGLLALAWLPFASRLPVEVELAPVAVRAPAPAVQVPSLFADTNGPFVTPVTFDKAAVSTVESGFWEQGKRSFDSRLIQTSASGGTVSLR